MKKTLILIISLLAATLSFGQSYTYKGENSDKRYVKQAAEVAEKFLDAVQSGDVDLALTFCYQKQDESGNLRPSVPALLIKGRIRQRSEIGNPLSRRLKSAEASSAAQTFPDSKYITLIFTSKYERKENVFDRVVVKIEGDQSNKVVRY